MVIGDFNLGGIAGAKLKTDTPLVIDPDAVLALAWSLELFQAVARHPDKRSHVFSGMQHL